MTRTDNVLRDVLEAMLADVEVLIRLHGQELNLDVLTSLASAPAQSWFAMALHRNDAEAGLELLDAFFKTDTDLAQQQELLAVEYADLYLTFGKRIAPNESYWRTEDHIERQEPMFAVRDWYAHYGLRAPNWRKVADDHLMSELFFVAALLKDGRDHALLDAGRFLDRHLLMWSHDFFAGMASRAESRFYAGLALVSEAVLQTIRDTLAELTGEARTVFAAATIPSVDDGETVFAPGAAPGW